MMTLQNNLQEKDAEERRRALNPTESYIVQAPAGSGKTELLTQRFLVLLSCVKQPEEILAITFTKKSAAEMRSRIIHALQRAQNESQPEAKHAQHTWSLARKALQNNDTYGWNLLENPSRLQIQTIDSLNASLTRQLPLLSHFGAPLEIADNPHALYQKAVSEFLSHLEENVAWSDAIETLLKHRDNDLNKVENLLINMLAKRDQWLHYIAFNANHPELRSILENHLETIVTDTLSTLCAHFPQECASDIVMLASFAGQNCLRDDPASSIAICHDLTNLPGSTIHDKTYWLGIAKLLLTDDGDWRKSITKKQGFPAPSESKKPEEKLFLTQIKQRMKSVIDQLSQHEDLQLALIELQSLPDHYYSNSQWETLYALHDVLRVVVAQLKIIFQQHGKVDYIENAQAALSALGSDDAPTDITLALDYKIQHILIDEFQDTSNSQYRLLEKLMVGWQTGDGRTLFVVGDPMQSIYRFREAEVGLFIRARQKGIGHVHLEPLTLSVNFRSTSSIVNWINDHFTKILPPFDDIACGAVSYSPSIANTSTPETISEVTLHPFANVSEETQANTIVELITHLKETQPGESIAVLVRSRTHLQQIIPSLKAANLSFRALDIDPLSTRAVIQDLLALTRALLHPADRIAWLAILRAPWCGLSLSDLLIIADDRFKSIIWQQLQSAEVINSLSLEGQKRLNRIIPFLKQAMDERRRLTLRQWVEQCWLQLGGPACVDHPTDLEDAQAFFRLLEKIDEANDLADLETLTTAINKLYAATNTQADSQLQIMTIHNSKGLEFDTVILPHLERKASRDEKQLLQWMERPLTDESSALILAPIHAVGEKNNSIYDYIKKQNDIKTAYENARLLYVAATRAKKQLHLFFNLEISSDYSEINRPKLHSLLEKLWPAIHNEIEKKFTNTSFATNATGQIVIKEKNIKRLICDWQNPIKTNYDEMINYHNKSGFELPNHHPKFLGIVIHQILQQMSELGVAWWQSQTLDNQEIYIKQHLIRLGMIGNAYPDSIALISHAVQNILNDSKGHWILHSHSEARSELALTTVINGKLKNLVIDRTFVDDKGIRWIIDFKSTQYSGSLIEQFLHVEQMIYQNQLWEYHQALQALDTKPIRVGLYFPLIPAWREWNFEN